MLSGKTGRNDPCPCGSGKKYKQCCLLKLQPQAPLQPQALDAATGQLLMDGFARCRESRWDEAAAMCAKVLKVRPEQPDALHLLGLIEKGRGRLEQALVYIDRALALAPNFSMQSNRGIVLQALGRHGEAAQSYRAALLGQPDVAALHCNLAACLEAQHCLDEAGAAYRRALELDPSNVSALCGVGFWLQMQGDLTGAQEHLRRALAQQPRHVASLSNLGNVLWSLGDMAAALALYEQAVQIAPDDVRALHNLGEALLHQSRMEDAREVFDRAYRVEPSLDRRMRRDLLLPHVCESREQMLQWRADFESHVDALLNDCDPVDALTAREYCSSIWKLAFHGEDDLELMRKLARMYTTLCPDLAHRAPHVDQPRTEGRRLRLGFFSSFLEAQHSVPRCVAALICQLAEVPHFEVYLIAPRAVEAEKAGVYADFKGRFLAVGKDYVQARKLIEAEQLDVLVYQDIGMDAQSYFMAHARLARIQCVLGGHPVTTGIPNVDCFVSTALAESEDAAAHYSEELLLLPSLPVVYSYPQVPTVLKGRADMGLPERGALYLCPMMLQKLHPDFDQAIEKLLQRDPSGHVVLFRHANARWEDQLQQRFARTITESVRDRIVFLPWLDDYDDFISVNALADVVIDPFHFGIGSTVVATFAVGTPFVTWPGEFLRGRAGLAYCRLMDLVDDCVANGLDDYVERAIRIAHDPVLRLALKQRIIGNKPRLFENVQPVREMAQLFEDLADRLVTVRGAA